MYAVVARRAVPAAPEQPAVRRARSASQVVALVERDLAGCPLPSAFITCSTNADSLRSSVCASNCGLLSSSSMAFDCALARGGEHDAAVRQIVRRDVVAFGGDRVGLDHAVQVVARRCRTPRSPRSADLPRPCCRRAGRASRTRPSVPSKETSTILDVVEVRSPVTRSVMFVSVALGEARSRLKRSASATVSRSCAQVVRVLGDRALHVEDGEIDGGRVGRLAAADVHAAAAAAGGNAAQRASTPRRARACDALTVP